jgi:uncharacterized membrane protein YjjB (DUF3815 family)
MLMKSSLALLLLLLSVGWVVLQHSRQGLYPRPAAAAAAAAVAAAVSQVLSRMSSMT